MLSDYVICSGRDFLEVKNQPSQGRECGITLLTYFANLERRQTKLEEGIDYEERRGRETEKWPSSNRATGEIASPQPRSP